MNPALRKLIIKTSIITFGMLGGLAACVACILITMYLIPLKSIWGFVNMFPGMIFYAIAGISAGFAIGYVFGHGVCKFIDSGLMLGKASSRGLDVVLESLSHFSQNLLASLRSFFHSNQPESSNLGTSSTSNYDSFSSGIDQPDDTSGIYFTVLFEQPKTDTQSFDDENLIVTNENSFT